MKNSTTLAACPTGSSQLASLLGCSFQPFLRITCPCCYGKLAHELSVHSMQGKQEQFHGHLFFP